MRAVGYYEAGPIDRPGALADLTLPPPAPGPRDLLVRIRAVSVNPVDTKVRAVTAPSPGAARVLGFDAAGVVEAVGDEVTLFRPGEAVFYAGDLTRSGTNAELHAVDERLVGRKPAALDWGQAAALPLTSITAWEALFDRLQVRAPVPGANGLLVIGSGGVGAMALQLARAMTDLPIVGTAALPEGADRVRVLGAHHVVDFRRSLVEGFADLGIEPPGFVFSTTHTDQHLPEIVALIAPQGRIAMIDDPASLDVVALKPKMLSLHWEYMFGRAMYRTPDMVAQHRLLNEVAALADAGRIASTSAKRLTPICAETLREAHRLVETGAVAGKVVLEGWP